METLPTLPLPSKKELATVDRNKYAVKIQSSQPPVVKIRAKDTKDEDYPEINEGEYYLQHGKVKVSLGAHPKIVLLDHRTSYSWYKDRLLAWTDEFEDFAFDKEVNLYYKKEEDKEPIKEFTGSQSEFFAWKKDEANEKWKERLKYKHVYYVYLPDLQLPAKMFVSNVSFNGVADGTDKVDFKNPQNNSFAMYHTKLTASGYRNALFEESHLLGSYLVEAAEKPYFCMCLEESTPHTDEQVKAYVLMMDRLQNVITKPQMPDQTADITFASEYTEDKVKVEDLPF